MKTMVYTREVSKNVGKKYLTLSDLHVFTDKDIKKLHGILDYLENNEGKGITFDAILLVGDIIDGTNVLRFNSNATVELIAFIKTLGLYAPTFICYGSHDLAFYFNGKLEKGDSPWCKDEEAFKSRLLDKIAGEKGINVLDGTQDIGDGYTISVYNPPLEYAMLKPDGDNRYLLQEKLNYEFLKSLNPNDINTLICHYPNVIRFLFEQGLLDNVDLGVGGNTRDGLGGKPNKDTQNLRGLVTLSDRTSLLVNPAYNNLPASTGILQHADGLFARGVAEIDFIPEVEEQALSRSRKN